MKLVAVIPVGPGREANLKEVIGALNHSLEIVIIDDGFNYDAADVIEGVKLVQIPKHEPGMEQPRNIGVRKAQEMGATHVWFLDSDVIPDPDALPAILAEIEYDPDRVLVCPYEWLDNGIRSEGGFDNFIATAREVHNDPRWEMFNKSTSHKMYLNDLSAGLACFSGNLVWPVEDFIRVGGFWSEIHHGRCEDGELGLRAVHMQVPISVVAAARGYHLWHERNDALAIERNKRDVPMLNERHPWVERGGVYLSDRDGAAFDVRCLCGRVIPTNAWWSHASQCPKTGMEIKADG